MPVPGWSRESGVRLYFLPSRAYGEGQAPALGSSLALCPLPCRTAATPESSPDSQAVSPQLDEATALEGTFDLRPRAANQGFKRAVVDVARSDQPQQPGSVANEPMLDEVIVLGDQYKPFQIRLLNQGFVWRVVTQGQVQCVQRVMATVGQPAAHPAWQLRIDQEFHAASRSIRLVCARRAAKSRTARMSSRSRSG